MLFLVILSVFFGHVASYKNALNNYVYKALEIPWMANLCYWGFSNKLTFEYWENTNINLHQQCNGNECDEYTIKGTFFYGSKCLAMDQQMHCKVI